MISKNSPKLAATKAADKNETKKGGRGTTRVSSADAANKNMAEIFMTAEGKKQLEERLKDLKVNGRAEMAEKIRVAREFGDLSENAEYDIAKEEQAKMEAEILDIEAKLRNVQIIDEKVKGDKIDVGSKVELKESVSGATFTYTIVGTHESNPMEGRISNESPIGKAILGKRKGDEVIVSAPAGDIKYKILNIK